MVFTLEYFKFVIGVNFLNYIYEVVAKHDWTIACKKKREMRKKISKHIAKSYKSACSSLASCQNTLIIDPDFAATRMIKRSR